MSEKARELAEILKNLCKTPFDIYSGTVESVDENNATIDVKIDGDIVLYDVRLRAVVDGLKGVVPIPANNSFVIVSKFDDGYYTVVKYSTLSKIIIDVPQISATCPDVVIEMKQVRAKCPDLVLNDGKNGGLPIAGNIAERLNVIEQLLADLLADYKIHTHPTAAPGSPSPPAKPFAKPAPSKTQASDLENPEIKH